MSRRTPWLSVLALLLVGATPALATFTGIIDFEGPPVTSTVLAVRYANQGVVIESAGPVLLQLPAANYPTVHAASGVTVLGSSPKVDEQDPDPLVLRFTTPVEYVAFATGIPRDTHGDPVRIEVTAFSGTSQVAQDGIDLVGPVDILHRLQVSTQPLGPIIDRIEIKAAGGDFEYIDDLTFVAEAEPPTLAAEPPTVVINTPAPGSVTQTGQVGLTGTIVGDGMFPGPQQAPPTFTITHSVASGALTPLSVTHPFTLGQNLQGSPPYSTLAFSLPWQLIDFGPHTITVSAFNPAGTGSDQTTVSFLPESIRREHQRNPGAYGDLEWGGSVGNCLAAVYQAGAIFTSPAGTFSVLGDIFNKWESLTTPGTLGRLGCATGAEQAVTGHQGSRQQDFQGGRVYKNATVAATYYSIEPFVDAIDRLGFAPDFGIPLTDPVEQSKYSLPRVWQKFGRSVGTSVFISSMEVAEIPPAPGRPPYELWVATPDLYGAQRAGLALMDISARVPTVWQSFDCQTLGKPCQNVAKPVPVADYPYSALSQACKGRHFPWGLVSQWPSLAQGKLVPFLGNVTASRLAGEDAFFNHDCIKGWHFPGVDWDIFAHPDPEYRNLVNSGKRAEIEIEYELCLVGYPWQKGDHPLYPNITPEENLKRGDKLFAAGRWTSDCGCHPWYSCSSAYHAEIHPPAILLNMYTALRHGQPATLGEMLMLDWWYPGETVEMRVFPPPRPTADSQLSVAVPRWTNLSPSDGGRAGVVDTLLPYLSPNHVRLVASGSPHIPQSHAPPREDPDGQLHHGSAKPVGPVERYVPGPRNAKSLWGYVEARWVTPTPP